jgi:hypothetical protein
MERSLLHVSKTSHASFLTEPEELLELELPGLKLNRLSEST